MDLSLVVESNADGSVVEIWVKGQAMVQIGAGPTKEAALIDAWGAVNRLANEIHGLSEEHD